MPGSTIDWVTEFRLKDEYLNSIYEKISPYAFYRDLFPVGTTQLKSESNSGKGNIVACRFTKHGEGKHMQHFLIGNDLSEEQLNYFIGYKGAYVTPISYFGKKRDKYHSHMMFAIVLDIDEVTVSNLKDLIHQYSNKHGYFYPAPNYIVNSSKGVHLYYLLKNPYVLNCMNDDFYKRMDAITELKKAMMQKAWNGYTSQKESRDAANIWQIFRAVGSLTKHDDGSVVSAYTVSSDKHTFDELNDLFHVNVDLSSLHKLTKKEFLERREKLKKDYPDYYQRVIVEGLPPKEEDYFDFPRGMYDAWIRRVIDQAVEGHRYYCERVLFINALKCNVPKEEALQDAMDLQPILDARTVEKEPFTKDDVMAAYRSVFESGEDRMDLMHRISTKWIIEQTGIDLPIAKRNGRKQEKHLARARAVQMIDYPNMEWININGAPTKEQVVKAWRKEHPEGKKIDCERETGLSRPTILKWWNEK